MQFDVNDEPNLDEITKNIQIADKNIYIEDKKKAIELISTIINDNVKQDDSKLLKLKKHIDDLFQLMNDCDIPDTFELQRKFEVLIDRLIEWGIASVLKGKRVVSMGGRFSSGKSCFINSVIGIGDMLPAEQNPTTAIPTYVVHSDIDSIEVNTKFGYAVQLDKESLEALSHKFYKKYSIGFSSVIENIIIKTKEFQIDSRIVFLDTPGYSKADDDNSVHGNSSDKQKAYEKLAITDYLIWLVDIQKGTITIEDLNFIRNLHLSSKVLFVFTRADKRPDEEIKKVLVEAKTTIAESGIDYYAITAFSSHNNKEYFGDYIQSFLKDVVKNKTGENDITEQINLLANDIRKKIVKEKYNSNKRKTNYYEVLSNTRNITSIKSVALLWKHENIRIMQIEKAYDLLKDIVKELHQVIEKH